MFKPLSISTSPMFLATTIGILAYGWAAALPPRIAAEDAKRSAKSCCDPWVLLSHIRTETGKLHTPETVEMLLAIVSGGEMGPEKAWFHAGQSRYGWEWLASRYDRNRDGKLTFDELPSRPAIRRLDRDRDEVVTADDLDWSAQSAYLRQGVTWAMWMRQADVNHNGKISRAEWDKLFTRLAGDKDFLVQSELREAFPLAPPAQRTPSGPVPMQEPTPWTLLKGLVTQELGALSEGPALNALAPDFTLQTQDGKREITLSQFRGKKPVALMFGNFTCGPFRTQSGNVDDLFRKYGDRVEFLAIYVREAHPTGGWRMETNDRVEIAIDQPRTMAERLTVAEQCSARLQLGMPLLVDDIDDRVNHLYSGNPTRLYLIDREGKVAYKAGRGPFGMKPGEFEQSLIMHLLDGDE